MKTDRRQPAPVDSSDVCTLSVTIARMKKALVETQTLRAGRTNAGPNIFAPPQTHFLSGGAGRPKFNQLEMVTTSTYRPSLVKIDARNFELS